jgi:hypothetical protein
MQNPIAICESHNGKIIIIEKNPQSRAMLSPLLHLHQENFFYMVAHLHNSHHNLRFIRRLLAFFFVFTMIYNQ